VHRCGNAEKSSGGHLAMTDADSSLSPLVRALIGDKPWSWTWKYNPNLLNHMHAFGVIAANYNDLEGQFYRLFFLTMGKMEAGKIVFAKLNNSERAEVALKAAETEPAAFRALFEYFISGYGTATENRNILMHSKAHNAWTREITMSHLILAKPSKKSPDENNFVSLDVSELRAIADDMANFSGFGWDLFLWRMALLTGGKISWPDGEVTTPTLPGKPPEPRKLSLSPQLIPIADSPRSHS
jgi:hypothetical protein